MFIYIHIYILFFNLHIYFIIISGRQVNLRGEDPWRAQRQPSSTRVFLCFPLIPNCFQCKKQMFPYVFYWFQTKTLFSLRFHKFLRKTCVFLTFSIGSLARSVFSLCFQQVPTENLCFPLVFHSFPRNIITKQLCLHCCEIKKMLSNWFYSYF